MYIYYINYIHLLSVLHLCIYYMCYYVIIICAIMLLLYILLLCYYLLYIFITYIYNVCYSVFITCIYYMHLFNIFILHIYAPDGTGSLEKFQESNTGMKGGFGEGKNPSLLFALHVFSSVSLP